MIVPNLEVLQQWAVAQNLQPRLPEEAGKAGENKGSTTATQEIDLENKVVQDLFRQELNREVQNRPGYRADDPDRDQPLTHLCDARIQTAAGNEG